MVRRIDRAQRQQDIAEAAIRLLAKGGSSALTLSALAAELGGSQTLITHFYPNRADLFRAITDGIIASYDEEIRRLENDAPPRERLRLLLEWMLPITRQAKLAERTRVLMISQMDTDASVKHFYDAMDKKMRQLLKDHLSPLVAADRVALTVDLLRVTINGVVLSTAEHPNAWSKARQLAVISELLDALGLAEPAPRAVAARARA